MAKRSTTWLVPVVISLALMGAAGVAWVALPSAGTTVTVGPSGAQYKTIQAAVDAAPDGSTIQIAAGTYKETVTIMNRTGLTLQGASQATVTLDGNGPQQQDLIPGILIKTSRSITIRGLTITNSRRGIYSIDSTGLTIDSCTCNGNLRSGIRLDNTQAQIASSIVRSGRSDLDGSGGGGIAVNFGSKVTLDNDTVSDNVVFGIEVVDTSQAVITNTRVTGTQFDSQGKSGDGIVASGQSNVTVQGCTISSNASSGAWIGGSADASVTGSTISENVWGGVQVRETASATITGNTIQENNYQGVIVLENAVAEITDNRILGTKKTLPPDNCCGSGVVGRGTSQVTVKGNTISGNVECGIWIGDAAHISVDTNTISGNQQGGIQVNGTATVSVSHSTIDGNWAFGVHLREKSQTTIADCHIVNTPTGSGFASVGLMLEGEAQATVTTSTISNNADTGILIVGSAHITLTNNIIQNNEGRQTPGAVYVGPDMYGKSQAVTAEISGNTISGNGGCGVAVGSSAGIHITGQGNKISGNDSQLCGSLSKFPAGFGGGK